MNHYITKAEISSISKSVDYIRTELQRRKIERAKNVRASLAAEEVLKKMIDSGRNR